MTDELAVCVVEQVVAAWHPVTACAGVRTQFGKEVKAQSRPPRDTDCALVSISSRVERPTRSRGRLRRQRGSRPFGAKSPHQVVTVLRPTLRCC